MVHMRISWGPSVGDDQIIPMQDSSADHLPLSESCPTAESGPVEKADMKGYHNATKSIDSLSDSYNKTLKKPIVSKPNETAVRGAKREIGEKVREDWSWPRISTQSEISPAENDDTREWRERESDSEYSIRSPPLIAHPYRFDSPDSIARPGFPKKRKRHELLEEEMQWNEGLRVFQERRNAWAGARVQPASRRPKHDSFSQSPLNTQLPTPPSPDPRSLSTSPLPSPTLLIPLAPPILPPSNPIRASIQPSTYPSIYDKIIIRGLSPTIPINLKDVVHTLVAGWKKDGEWPPKSEAEKEAAAAEMAGGGARGEGKRLAKRSVGRVKRVLGLGRGIDDPGRGERRQD